jgi:peptide/nickel transport system substrate-binding protein
MTTDGYDVRFQNHYPYNPTRARTLLTQAGYPDGFTLTILDTPAGGINAVGPVSALAKYFGDVGVKVNIVSPATAGEWVQRLTSSNMPAYINPRGGDPMWLFYGLYFSPRGVLNASGHSDPVMNRLWLQGQRAKQPATYWRQMSARSVTQALFVPLSTFQSIYYVNNRVTGVRVSRFLAFPDPTSWAPR